MSSLIERLSRQWVAMSILVIVVLLQILAPCFVPQGPASSEAFRELSIAHPDWAEFVLFTGTNLARNSWLFYLTTVLLVAWLGLRAIRSAAVAREAAALARCLSDADMDRLRYRPDATIELCAVSQAVDALRAIGMSVRSGPRIGEGRSGHWSDWAPSVTWCVLAAAMLVLIVGSATRFTGEIALPAGESVADSQVDYLWTDAGPLARGRNTRMRLTVTEIVHPIPGAIGTDGDVLLSISGSDRGSKSVWLHDACSIGVGRLTLRKTGIGRLAVMSLESTAGAQLSYSPVILERDPTDQTSFGPGLLTLSDESGRMALDVRVYMRVPRQEVPTTTPPAEGLRAIIETATPQSGEYGASTEIELGQTFPLLGGQRVRFISDDEWVRMLVVDDWTFLPLLTLLALATAAAAVGLWFPRRTVAVLDAESDEVPAVNVVVWSTRNDARFRARVLERLTVACAAPRDETGVTAEPENDV